MTQPTGCPHERRIHLGDDTRREVERFFDGLEVSTGTVDLFDGVDTSVLNILNAEGVSWCRDCSHVLITWLIGDDPLDMPFPNQEAEGFLRVRLQP
jgi:hypothetical protein